MTAFYPTRDLLTFFIGIQRIARSLYLAIFSDDLRPVLFVCFRPHSLVVTMSQKHSPSKYYGFGPMALMSDRQALWDSSCFLTNFREQIYTAANS